MASLRFQPLLLFLLSSIMATMMPNISAGAATVHLHFYMHDIVTAPSPTAVRVIKGTMPLPNSINNFGDTYIIDDILTENPSQTSHRVGRAQGFYIFAAQTDSTLMLNMNLVFTKGVYNGSTLAVMARDAILEPVRELPVIGGSGKFKMARGYGLMKTYSFNMSTNNAVLEIDMHVDMQH